MEDLKIKLERIVLRRGDIIRAEALIERKLEEGEVFIWDLYLGYVETKEAAEHLIALDNAKKFLERIKSGNKVGESELPEFLESLKKIYKTKELHSRGLLNELKRINRVGYDLRDRCYGKSIELLTLNPKIISGFYYDLTCNLVRNFSQNKPLYNQDQIIAYGEASILIE